MMELVYRRRMRSMGVSVGGVHLIPLLPRYADRGTLHSSRSKDQNCFHFVSMSGVSGLPALRPSYTA